MKIKALNAFSGPRLYAEEKDGVGRLFDLEIPKEELLALAGMSIRWLFHNGTPEEKHDLKFMIEQWALVYEPKVVATEAG